MKTLLDAWKNKSRYHHKPSFWYSRCMMLIDNQWWHSSVYKLSWTRIRRHMRFKKRLTCFPVANSLVGSSFLGGYWLCSAMASENFITIYLLNSSPITWILWGWWWAQSYHVQVFFGCWFGSLLILSRLWPRVRVFFVFNTFKDCWVCLVDGFGFNSSVDYLNIILFATVTVNCDYICFLIWLGIHP